MGRHDSAMTHPPCREPERAVRRGGTAVPFPFHRCAEIGCASIAAAPGNLCKTKTYASIEGGMQIASPRTHFRMTAVRVDEIGSRGADRGGAIGPCRKHIEISQEIL